MRRLLPLLALLAVALPALPQTVPSAARLADRAAIHEVMQQYVWSVDSLDADGYVAVFTEDAEIDSNGTLIKGHEAIRKVVTDMAAPAGQSRGGSARRPPLPCDQQRADLLPQRHRGALPVVLADPAPQ